MFESAARTIFNAISTRKNAKTTVPQASYEDSRHATEMFNQAVQEDWNVEMDWLWLATVVTLGSQQRFCYEKALNINPNSKMAKRGLRRSGK